MKLSYVAENGERRQIVGFCCPTAVSNDEATDFINATVRKIVMSSLDKEAFTDNFDKCLDIVKMVPESEADTSMLWLSYNNQECVSPFPTPVVGAMAALNTSREILETDEGKCYVCAVLIFFKERMTNVNRVLIGVK